jgi:hypothetical protein
MATNVAVSESFEQERQVRLLFIHVCSGLKRWLCSVPRGKSTLGPGRNLGRARYKWSKARLVSTLLCQASFMRRLNGNIDLSTRLRRPSVCKKPKRCWGAVALAHPKLQA